MRLASVFPGFGVGGAQTRFCALANRLGDACSHVIVSLNRDVSCREKLFPEIKAEFPNIAYHRGNMAAGVRSAMQHLRAIGPDLVVTSNWGAIEWAIAARLCGLRHLHTEDGFGPEEATAQIPRRVLTRRLALRGSDTILPSRTLLKIATEQWRLPKARLHYIPNGIDTAKFARAISAVPPGDGPVIGTIAALRPEKNFPRLIQAFQQVRQTIAARLVIVGDGPERGNLERLAKDLGVGEHVTFTGYSAAPETWMAGFDIFALSSDTEQMPLSVLEAMAAGLPVVSTNVGDVRHMLASENRCFVTAREASAFAAAILSMLGEPVKGREIGAKNQALAARIFDQEAMFSAYAKLFGLRTPFSP